MMELKPIGYVRSAVNDRKKMTTFGVSASIEILPEYEDALLHVEKHTHIWVMAWIDRGERDLCQVVPRGGSEKHGVFAVRSPARPNPIGLTAAKLLKREGRVLHVDKLDFIDGTTVLDIKPYLAPRDLIYSAESGSLGRGNDQLASMRFQGERFHGELNTDVELGAQLLAEFREAHGTTDGWVITVPASRPRLIDCVMGATRASLGRGTLLLWDEDAVRFERDGQTVLKPCRFERG